MGQAGKEVEVERVEDKKKKREYNERVKGGWGGGEGWMEVSQYAIMEHEKEKIKWTKTSRRWAERASVIEMEG